MCPNTEETYAEYALNTSTSTDDSMWCDGNSEPFDDWDYSSPQPEIDEWDSN